MPDFEYLKNLIDKSFEMEDILERKLWITAVVTKAFEDANIVPIIVGGTAVAFYTLGGYSTIDIDLVMPIIDKTGKIMEALGFSKFGRFWERKDLDCFIEAPDDILDGDKNRVIEIEIEDLRARVIGIEDLIIDRLKAYVHWQSKEDLRWAVSLYKQQIEVINFPYLYKRALSEKVKDALDECINENS